MEYINITENKNSIGSTPKYCLNVTEQDIAAYLGLNYDADSKLLYMGDGKDYCFKIVVNANSTSNFDSILIYPVVNGVAKTDHIGYYSIIRNEPTFLCFEKTENSVMFGIKNGQGTKIWNIVCKATDKITNDDKVLYVGYTGSTSSTYGYLVFCDGIDLTEICRNFTYGSLNFVSLVPFNIPKTSIVANDIFMSVYADKLSAKDYPIAFNIDGKQYSGMSLGGTDYQRLFLETEV